jgi:hypothetical protein
VPFPGALPGRTGCRAVRAVPRCLPRDPSSGPFPGRAAGCQGPVPSRPVPDPARRRAARPGPTARPPVRHEFLPPSPYPALRYRHPPPGTGLARRDRPTRAGQRAVAPAPVHRVHPHGRARRGPVMPPAERNPEHRTRRHQSAPRRREADLGLPSARTLATVLLSRDRAGQSRPGSRDARRRPIPGRAIPGAGVLRRQQPDHRGPVPARRGRPLRRACHRPRRLRRRHHHRAARRQHRAEHRLLPRRAHQGRDTRHLGDADLQAAPTSWTRSPASRKRSRAPVGSRTSASTPRSPVRRGRQPLPRTGPLRRARARRHDVHPGGARRRPIPRECPSRISPGRPGRSTAICCHT